MPPHEYWVSSYFWFCFMDPLLFVNPCINMKTQNPELYILDTGISVILKYLKIPGYPTGFQLSWNSQLSCWPENMFRKTRLANRSLPRACLQIVQITFRNPAGHHGRPKFPEGLSRLSKGQTEFLDGPAVWSVPDTEFHPGRVSCRGDSFPVLRQGFLIAWQGF